MFSGTRRTAIEKDNLIYCFIRVINEEGEVVSLLLSIRQALIDGAMTAGGEDVGFTDRRDHAGAHHQAPDAG
jgi:hypothetical protein